MDEIESLIGLRPTPLTWPVVIAGDFLGVWERSIGDHAQQLPSRLRVPLSGSDHLT